MNKNKLALSCAKLADGDFQLQNVLSERPNTSVGLMQLYKILILTPAWVARAIRDDLNLKTCDEEVSQSQARTRY